MGRMPHGAAYTVESAYAALVSAFIAVTLCVLAGCSPCAARAAGTGTCEAQAPEAARLKEQGQCGQPVERCQEAPPF